MADTFQVALSRIRETRAAAVVKGVPAGAMSSVHSYVNTQMGQPDQFSSESAINNAYLAELYTYRCIQSIVNSITARSFRAGPDMLQPQTWSKTSPLSQLLSRDAKGSPNPYWSSTQLLKYSLGQYKLTGKTAFLKGIDGSGKRQLWPLQIQMLKPVPAGPRANAYFKGFEYGQMGTQNFRTFTPDEIYYLWNPSLADMFQPESVIQAGQLSISVNRMMALYDYNFLKNNATPSTLVVTPPFAERNEKRAFQDQFLATYGGYSNAGKTVFLESEDADNPGQGGAASDPVQVTKLGSTSKEAQFVEMRDQYASEVCLAWGVPRSVLTDSSNAKYTNMANDRVNYWMETLQPTANDFTDQINTHVAPDMGDDLGWFDLSAVPELKNTAALSTALAGLDLVVNNIWTRDELREICGMPPAADVEVDDGTKLSDIPVGPLPGQTAEILSKTNPLPLTDSQKQHVAADGTVQPTPQPAATPPPVELPQPAPGARSEDMLAAARARRVELETRAKGRIATVWRTHHVAGHEDNPCKICAPLDGQVDNGLTPVKDTHPNCECTNNPTRVISPGKRSDEDLEVRHAGPEGHSHVPSGHTTMAVLKRMLNANLSAILADASAESGKRLGGQRGQRMAREAASSPGRLYDAAHWQPRIELALTPVLGEQRGRLLSHQFGQNVLSSLGEQETLLPGTVDTILSGAMSSFIKQVEAEMAFPSEESA